MIIISVCWLPTAANITVETQRQLLSNLADLVEDRGFNVKAQCFDAKTRDLVVRGMLFFASLPIF